MNKSIKIGLFIVFGFVIITLLLVFNKSKMKVSIDGEYSKLVNETLQMIESNLKQNNLKYETFEYKNDDIYSFLLKVKDVYPYFISYNIDLNDKEFISNEDLLKKFNLSFEDVNKKIEKRLLKLYNKEVDDGYIKLNDYTFDEYLSYYRGIDEIDYCYVLVVRNNKLYAYLNFETNNTSDKEFFDNLKYDPYKVEL